MKKGSPSKYKRIWSGWNVSATGLGIDFNLVKSDGSQLQRLVDFIDDKRVFFDPMHLENPVQIIEPVKQTRKLATAIASSAHSVEAAEIAKKIASACRHFMRDFSDQDPRSIWAPVLSALRSEVEFQVSVAVYDFKLSPPKNLLPHPLPDGGYSD